MSADNKNGNMVVTPWEVKGDIDYNKLIERFGTQPLTEELKERIAKHAGYMHMQLRRNVYFSHRDLDWWLNEYDAGRPVGLYTGRGPSGGGLRSVPWSRIFSLPEGTPIFVGGALFAEEGRGVFRDHGNTRLLVVIHDCAQEKIVSRAIRSGRQRNEYMNAFTLPSVAIGSLSLLLLGFSLLAGHPEIRGVALLALTAGLAPVSPFLPPGFPLYFAYRSYWKKARLMRAQRDVVRLPLRYFPPSIGEPRARRETLLPDKEPYLMIRGTMAENDPNVIVCDGARVSLPTGIGRIPVDLPARWGRPSGEGRTRGCVVFAAYRETPGGILLQKPEDPMAEQILVPGDPQWISHASEQIARRYEIVSGFFISLNMVVNVPLMFVLLALLIR